MTRVEYLRTSTLLPLATPIVLAVPVSLLLAAGLRVPEWLGFAATTSFMAVLVFGLPYAAVIAVLLLVAWRLCWKAHLAAALVAPVLMVVAVGVFLRVGGEPEVSSIMRWTFAPWCLGVGYAYVGLMLIGMWALEKTGRFSPEPTAREAWRR
jgi:hypothetical protein